jgi:hypothetical protein
VTEPLAPEEREGVAEAETVELELSVDEGVLLLVPVLVPVLLEVGVTVPLPLALALLLSLKLGVAEGLAPRVSEDVDETLTVVLMESELLGVAALLPVPELVGVPVEEEVGVGGGVPLLDRLTDAELEAEAPDEREAVGDIEVVELAERLEVGEMGVFVLVAVAEPVPD